ncbi:DUF397 domain-containing protein [Lentzea albida]|uniref:DUF397 domain-containing protein n=1 Tax=Lentzea albida TaxID=65499 RepID=A0A1H9IPC8_9PSEU|nr:DUF397 domain-containing protein [Lentzea albida]SEQ76444.1 protein of unknown function [Lentzea albida]
MIGQKVSASPREWSGWFTSSYTNASGSCVEVNLGAHSVLVRDSKDRRADQPVMRVSSAAWTSFVKQVC